MTVAANLASQRRSLSLPAARRSTNAMASRRRRSSSDRLAAARPAHLRNQPRPPSSLSTARLRDNHCRRDKPEPAASLKSP